MRYIINDGYGADKINGTWECYTVYDGRLMFARVGKRGKLLSASAKNMFNIKVEGFEDGIKTGVVKEISP